ncbi:conserved Plasmodium protein, unknown function [Plasmodium ovale wallikeri]|uniref:Uncharacterized protein n=1 Tax=Plasmodium ovale wallikeri TaxID=864142 RepID=A0A1A8YTR7_PLAOA|nr:conserved Plasmodium protein, unknown function [Plasmodium ovale wallikeri]SBT35482.1 conserved Plasmodium protein, unknown function [Plasmodium ovale wallikeri]
MIGDYAWGEAGKQNGDVCIHTVVAWTINKKACVMRGKEGSSLKRKNGKSQSGKSQRGKCQRGKSQRGKSQRGKCQRGKSQNGKEKDEDAKDKGQKVSQSDPVESISPSQVCDKRGKAKWRLELQSKVALNRQLAI